MTAKVIEKFGKQLNVFTAKLDLFAGTSDLHDFISDFESYCEYLGKDTDSEKLGLLRTHLTGEAKDVFRLVENPTVDSVISALKIRFAPTEHALHRVKAELFGAKQTSGETFKQFAIRIQNAARHTDISQLDLVRIAITGARSGLVKSHLLMAAPHTMNALIKLPVVNNDDLYSNASLDQFSLLTAAVGKLTSQVAELSKSSTSASRNDVRPRDRHSAKPSDGRRQRMTPYRPQQLCRWCNLKFCQGRRLCVAYTKNCRNCGKMGHFEKCCYQPTNYFNAKH